MNLNKLLVACGRSSRSGGFRALVLKPHASSLAIRDHMGLELSQENVVEGWHDGTPAKMTMVGLHGGTSTRSNDSSSPSGHP